MVPSVRALGASLGLLLALSGRAWARPPLPATVTAGQDETCDTLLKRFHWRVSAEELHRLNPLLGKHAGHAIAEGTVLRLRESTDPVAKILAAQEPAETKGPGKVPWRTARPGGSLVDGSKVATEAGGSAEIELKTGVVALGESAMLVTRALAPPKAAWPGGAELQQGRAIVTARSAVALDTPAAKLVIEPGETRVEVDAQGTTRVTVLRGRATATSEGEQRAVEAGTGVVIAEGSPPGTPHALPPPPAWLGATRVTRVALRDLLRAHEIAWTPVEGARRTLATIAGDARFERVLGVRALPGDTSRMRLDDLASGRYFVHLATVDADGLEGRPSDPFELVVVQVRSTRSRAVADGRVLVEVGGKTELSLADDARGLSVRLDGIETTLPTTLADGGIHRVEVRAEGASSDTFVVEVDELRLRLVPGREEVPAEGGTVDLVVRAVDGQGAEHALPTADVTYAGKKVAVSKRGDGTLSCTVAIEPTSARREVSIRAALPGDTSPRAELAIRQAGPLPPRRFEPVSGGLAQIQTGTPGTLSEPLSPFQDALLTIMAGYRSLPTVEVADYALRAAFAPTRRLALDLSVGGASAISPGGKGSGGTSSVGAGGVRVRVHDRDRTSIAVEGTAGASFGASAIEPAGQRFGGAGVLGWRSERTALQTAHGAEVLRRTDGVRAAGRSSVMGLYELRRGIGLSVFGAGLFGKGAHTNGPVAAMAGAGVHVSHAPTFGGLALGIYGQAGLGSAGKDEFGALSVRIALSIALDLERKQ